MIVKQPWMKLGATVLAKGIPAVITSRVIKSINGTDFLMSCKVKSPDAKFSTWCKPEDLQQLKEKEVEV